MNMYCGKSIVSPVSHLVVFVSREEAQEYIDIGALNGLFVLGRSMGFIGEICINSTSSCTIYREVSQC